MLLLDPMPFQHQQLQHHHHRRKEEPLEPSYVGHGALLIYLPLLAWHMLDMAFILCGFPKIRKTRIQARRLSSF